MPKPPPPRSPEEELHLARIQSAAFLCGSRAITPRDAVLLLMEIEVALEAVYADEAPMQPTEG